MDKIKSSTILFYAKYTFCLKEYKRLQVCFILNESDIVSYIIYDEIHMKMTHIMPVLNAKPFWGDC